MQYRLTDIDKLDLQEDEHLRAILMKHCGRNGIAPVGYDAAGAMFSGLRVVPWLPFARANLETVFCSELIAAVLQRLGRMNRSNPARFNPGRLLRRLVQQGTYRRVCRYDNRGAA